MSIKEAAVGTVVTIVIGGTAYTINQTDVINNFADDTGLTQQQAEQYVNEVNEDELVPYGELGSDYINDGQEVRNIATQTDCVNYEYEWESTTLSCEKGKAQLDKIGKDSISLGKAYKKLGSDSASRDDISTTIGLIDKLNSDYEFDIVSKLLDQATVDDVKKSNSYNKAVLKAALEND